MSSDSKLGKENEAKAKKGANATENLNKSALGTKDQNQDKIDNKPQIQRKSQTGNSSLNKKRSNLENGKNPRKLEDFGELLLESEVFQTKNKLLNQGKTLEIEDQNMGFEHVEKMNLDSNFSLILPKKRHENGNQTLANEKSQSSRDFNDFASQTHFTQFKTRPDTLDDNSGSEHIQSHADPMNGTQMGNFQNYNSTNTSQFVNLQNNESYLLKKSRLIQKENADSEFEDLNSVGRSSSRFGRGRHSGVGSDNLRISFPRINSKYNRANNPNKDDRLKRSFQRNLLDSTSFFFVKETRRHQEENSRELRKQIVDNQRKKKRKLIQQRAYQRHLDEKLKKGGF